jgi:nucleotide-binding universal stress UspA family protein
MSRILVGYDGSNVAKRALDRAVVEARDRHVRTAVVSVASMPLDLDAPRYDGTLDDIHAGRGATALAAARDRRAPRGSARDPRGRRRGPGAHLGRR